MALAMSSGILSRRPHAITYPPLFSAVSDREKAANSSEYAPYTAGLKRTLYGNIVSSVGYGEHHVDSPLEHGQEQALFSVALSA
jgi:hypothetical protein